VKSRLFVSSYVVFFILLTTVNIGCGGSAENHDHDHDEHEATFERGLHNGRLLLDGSFSIELQVFETGVAPQYRVYGFENDLPIPPSELNASVTIKRLGGKLENFTFHPVADFLTSDI